MVSVSPSSCTFDDIVCDSPGILPAVGQSAAVTFDQSQDLFGIFFKSLESSFLPLIIELTILFLWLGLASDSFESKVFPIGFLRILSEVVALWDESVAISVHIEELLWDESVAISVQIEEFLYCRQQRVLFWRCLLARLASLCHLVPGGCLLIRSLQLCLRESWDFPDEVVVSWTQEIKSDLKRWSDDWIFSENTTALAYVCKQGGTLSPVLNREAQLLIRWLSLVSLVSQFVVKSRNVVADSLTCRIQVIRSEWTLVQEVVDDLLQRWPATVDLFATCLN